MKQHSCILLLMVTFWAFPAKGYATTSVPDFEDGSWQMTGETDWQLTAKISPVEQLVFTIGKIRHYRSIIDAAVEGNAMVGINDPAKIVCKAWGVPGKEDAYSYALPTEKAEKDGWTVGSRMETDIEVVGLRMRQVTLSIRTSGAAVSKIVIANPHFVPPSQPLLQHPPISPLGPAPARPMRTA